jgi:hypothetical protein
MGLRRPPSAFTQEGIAMLSSVLRSERAIQMNIAVMRAFAALHFRHFHGLRIRHCDFHGDGA